MLPYHAIVEVYGIEAVVGFEFESYEYDDEDNSLNIDVIDFGVDIR